MTDLSKLELDECKNCGEPVLVLDKGVYGKKVRHVEAKDIGGWKFYRDCGQIAEV